MTEAEGAIGIIGGADGPTVVFISGNMTALVGIALALAAVAIAAVAACVVCWKRRRKKHQA